MGTKKSVALAVTLAMALVLGACGGDDDATDSDTDVTIADTDATTADTDATSGETDQDADEVAPDTTEESGAPATDAPSDDPDLDTGKVDEAAISLSSRLNTLDPAGQVVQPDIITQYLVSGRLFQINDDFSVKPELAESYEYSEDGLTLTIQLKAGLLYSDGTPILAEDVVFAYERQRDLGPSFAAFLGTIESANAPDDRTVVFELAQRNVELLHSLGTLYMGIHPKSQIEANESYFNAPVSAGPYVIQNWAPGATEWVLEENPNYVGGEMSIGRLRITSVADMTSRVLQLATGDIDYVYDLPVAARDSLPDDIAAIPAPINGSYLLAVNLTLPDDHPLQDQNVRKAISLAIDREQISETAFGGISEPLSGYSYPANPYGLFDVLPSTADLEGARAAMAASSFPEGFSVEIQTWGQRAGWTDVALVMQENLSEIGIEVTVSPVEDAVGIANLRANDYELQFSGNAGNVIGFFRNMFVAGSFWADAVGLDDPELADLLDQALAAPTLEDAIALVQEAQAAMLELLPHIPVTERTVLVGNRLPDHIVEVNLPAGRNPWVRTLAELTS